MKERHYGCTLLHPGSDKMKQFLKTVSLTRHESAAASETDRLCRLLASAEKQPSEHCKSCVGT
jgi:hypothetical protein